MRLSSLFQRRWVRAALVSLCIALVGAAAFLWWMFFAKRTVIPLLGPAREEASENTREKESQEGSEEGTSRENRDVASPPIVALAQGLSIPWALAFLPDGSIIFTEREGRVRLIDMRGQLLTGPLLTLNDVATVGEGGLLGIAVHPRFADNRAVYLYYTARRGGETIVNRVVRYRLENNQLRAPSVILDNIPAGSNHDGGRIAFGPDGMLYITTGDAGVEANAQDTTSLAGKILRLQDDGTIPADNPFTGSPIWSYGHRNPQGLAWDRAGNLWATEHGPSAKDEINRIEAGKNYGWPRGSGENVPPDTVAPVVHSGTVTWAPSGAAILDNTLYFAGLRSQTLYALSLTQAGGVGELRSLFIKEFGRLRSVTVGPDGALYLLTNNRDGRGLAQTRDDQIIRVQPQALRPKP